MIYDIPHIKSFGKDWGNLKIQWETVHLPPARKDGNGGSVYLDIDWLEYIQAMNTRAAFQWMIGESGTIIWGIRDKKNLANKINKPRMPVIAIGGNKISIVDGTIVKIYGLVHGMSHIDYSITPKTHPEFWHRIWCVTKLKHGLISTPHDTPRGPAFLPILDVYFFKRTKALAGGSIFIKVA